MKARNIFILLCSMPVILSSSLAFGQSASDDRIQAQIDYVNHLFTTCIRGEISAEELDVKSTAAILELQTQGLYTPEKAKYNLSKVKEWVDLCKKIRSYTVEAENKKLALIKGEISEQEYKNFHIEHLNYLLQAGLLDQENYNILMAKNEAELQKYKQVANQSDAPKQNAQIDTKQPDQTEAEIDFNNSIDQMQNLLKFCLAGTYTPEKYEQEVIKLSNQIYRKGYIDTETFSQLLNDVQHDKRLCEDMRANINTVNMALEKYKKGELSVEKLRLDYAVSLNRLKKEYDLPNEFVTESLLELENEIKAFQKSK